MNYIAQLSQTGLSNPYPDPSETGVATFFILFWVVIIALAIFDMVFRVKAMWRAARLSDKGWFICLFLFNTVGILPIIYLRANKDRYRKIILKNHSD